MPLGAALASIKGQVLRESSDVHDLVSFVSHFRPSDFCTVEGPDGHRAMGAHCPEGQSAPRVIPGTVRVPLGICISSMCKMSISSVK